MGQQDTFLTANVRLVGKLVVRRNNIGLIELNKVLFSSQIYEKNSNLFICWTYWFYSIELLQYY